MKNTYKINAFFNKKAVFLLSTSLITLNMHFANAMDSVGAENIIKTVFRNPRAREIKIEVGEGSIKEKETSRSSEKTKNVKENSHNSSEEEKQNSKGSTDKEVKASSGGEERSEYTGPESSNQIVNRKAEKGKSESQRLKTDQSSSERIQVTPAIKIIAVLSPEEKTPILEQSILEQFNENSYYKVINKYSGNVLNSWGVKKGKGSATMQGDVDNEWRPYRLWQIIRQGEYYKIKNVKSRNVLNGWSVETGRGSATMQGDVDNEWRTCRLWRILRQGDYYKIKNVYSRNVLTSWGYERGEGTATMQADGDEQFKDQCLWLIMKQ